MDSNFLLRLYLWVFPRPKFQDIELKRLSNVCSDINGMTIVILVAFMGQNAFANITKAAAIFSFNGAPPFSER